VKCAAHTGHSPLYDVNYESFQSLIKQRLQAQKETFGSDMGATKTKDRLQPWMAYLL